MSYNYICAKTQNFENDETGFWKGITIKPELIPECSFCKRDNENFGSLVKQNPNAKVYEFENECFKSCIWWEWFHDIRKLKCGCLCKGVCSCGKLKYIDKKKKVVEKVEKKTSTSKKDRK